MKSIFEYQDFRAFLRDHYEARKKDSPSYSFRFFAKKAGLKSPNYYKLVMDGDRSLTHRHIRKFITGLGLGNREGHYFENLVFYTQAKEGEEKEFFVKNLEMIRAQDDRDLLTHDQYQLLSMWHHLAIKELVLLKDVEKTPKKLAARLNYKITPQEAKDAVDLLVRIGLLAIDKKTGELRVTKQSLQTPDATRSHALAMFHKSVIELAGKSIDEQDANERCVSALTVAIRKKDLKEAFTRIHRFRDEMDAFFVRKKPYDAVYQLNLHLFRLDTDV